MKRFFLIFSTFLFFGLIFGGWCLAERRLVIWSINPGTAFGNLTDQKALEFSADSPEAHLESVHFDNTFYKFKLRTALENNQAPDIFHNWGANSIRSYVEQGRVVALDEILSDVRAHMHPKAFAPVTFENRIYGVPYSGLAAVFFWYRTDVFATYNLQPPQTWEEFISVGEKLKQNGIIPVALANKNKWPGSFFYMYLVDRIGGPDLFSDALAGRNDRSFADPAFIKAGELIQELVERKFFPQGFNRSRDEPGNWNSLIISGQAGMYLMGSWFLGVLDELPPELKESFDFFPFPVVAGGLGEKNNLIGSPGQDYLSISADSDNVATAIRFLSEYICNDRYYMELAAQGFVPPVANSEDYLTNPLTKKVARAFHKADHIQLYYDQVLSSSVSEGHKLLVHQLFELQLTPEQAAQSHEEMIRRQLLTDGTEDQQEQ